MVDLRNCVLLVIEPRPNTNRTFTEQIQNSKKGLSSGSPFLLSPFSWSHEYGMYHFADASKMVGDRQGIGREQICFWRLLAKIGVLLASYWRLLAFYWQTERATFTGNPILSLSKNLKYYETYFSLQIYKKNKIFPNLFAYVKNFY